MADEQEQGLDVLRGIWSGRGQSGVDVGGSAKVCKNMKNIGFGGMAGEPADGESTAGPVDEDQRAAWRARLAREGKLGTTTVREMILGDPS